MVTTQVIQDSILESLSTLGLSEPTEIKVEPTANPIFGEYTTNIAMRLFPSADRSRWNSPLALATAIADTLNTSASDYLQQVTAVAPGFINFTLSNESISNSIRETLEKENSVKYGAGKSAVVEYSSPNIAKPFTVGHLRSTIIGDAIANLLEAVGYTVYRDNHLGDWGTQFGKLIVAIKELGEGRESSNIERITTSQEPVKELVQLYVEFHEKAESDPELEEKARAWFTKLEQGDKEARELWRLCIDWSWQEFDRIYKELGVTFTENDGRGYGESFFEDKMGTVVEELERHPGLFKVGENGAKLFFFPEDVLPPLMILKKDGSTLYATRDLATDRFRLKRYGNDTLIINEVGAEQELYFRQLYKIEELLGWYAPGHRVHVKHGHFRFKDGKMSTRKGNVIWLADVISEAKKRALQLTANGEQQTADKVAIGALKWNDLKRAAHLDVTFDWDEMLSMNGNSGPYLQYTAVRCKSILEKADDRAQGIGVSKTYSFDEVERRVARTILYYPAVVEQSAREYAPHQLCTYLYSLASEFNSFYNIHKVIGSAEHEDKRLELTRATLQLLTEGLGILGITVPEKM